MLFWHNQATLSAESKQSVEKLASELLHVGLNKVNLDGHTDNYGDAGYNNDLFCAALTRLPPPLPMPECHAPISILAD